MPSDGSNNRNSTIGIMNVAGAVDNGKEMSGRCNMRSEWKIGVGSSFDRIVAFKYTAGAAFDADHRSILINGDLIKTQLGEFFNIKL